MALTLSNAYVASPPIGKVEPSHSEEGLEQSPVARLGSRKELHASDLCMCIARKKCKFQLLGLPSKGGL